MNAQDILRYAKAGALESYQRTAAAQAEDQNRRFQEAPIFDIRHSVLEERFQDLQKIKDLIREWQDIKLLPGDTVYMVFEDLEKVGEVGIDTARVTGVGFEGFTVSADRDNPDDMGELIRWSELDDSYFLTPEEAEADRSKRQKAIEEARE